MEREQFLNLLAKKHSDLLEPKEVDLYNQALLQSEDYRNVAHQLEQFFESTVPSADAMPGIDKIWAQIEQAERTTPEGTNIQKKIQHSILSSIWFRIASVLFLVVFFIYQYLNRPEANSFIQWKTQGSKAFKVLDDGTKVWLNRHSVLTYNEAFGKERREMRLTGEGYFEVVKNGAIPLHIRAGELEIEVKGTSFLVKTDAAKKSVEVALHTGLIEVSKVNDPTKHVSLKPNQKLMFNTGSFDESPDFKVHSVDRSMLLNESRWLTDTLVFNKEKLKDLVPLLAKKYSLKFEIVSPSLAEKRFSGTFVNETIEQVLAALKLSYPLSYTISQGTVTLKEDK